LILELKLARKRLDRKVWIESFVLDVEQYDDFATFIHAERACCVVEFLLAPWPAVASAPPALLPACAE